MIKAVFSFLFVNFVILALASFSNAVTVEKDKNKDKEIKSEYILCKLNKEVRTIRVVHSPAGMCKTQYTKGGLEQNVGQAKTNSICVGVVESIRKNLESQSWKCKDISHSEVSDNSNQVTY